MCRVILGAITSAIKKPENFLSKASQKAFFFVKYAWNNFSIMAMIFHRIFSD